MKKLLFIFTILSFTSCIAQKNLKMEQEIIIPQITKEFEEFNIEEFQAKNISKVIEEINERYIVYTGDTKKTKVKSGYSKGIYLKDSYFSITKNFYPNGGIEIKGISFNNGSEFGTWYEFNKEGKLINEINTDEGYDFGWLDVVKYCHKHDIQLEKGYPKRGGIKTEIYKNEEEGKKVWTISYYKPKTDEYIEVTLEGKTGKEIKRRDLKFIGN